MIQATDDYMHGKRVITPKLPEERDYSEDLATVPITMLQQRLCDTEAGLGFIRTGSAVHASIVKSISALRAEIARRSTTR